VRLFSNKLKEENEMMRIAIISTLFLLYLPAKSQSNIAVVDIDILMKKSPLNSYYDSLLQVTKSKMEDSLVRLENIYHCCPIKESKNIKGEL